MNKTELINQVAENAGITKKAADVAVTAVLDVISTSLSKGEPVKIIGFGAFEVRYHAARNGRNPQNGESMVIPASKSPAFKAGTELKAIVNN